MPPKTRAPRVTQDTLFKQLLVMYTLTVASLHWAISAYSAHTPAAAPAQGLQPRAPRLLELQRRVDGVWSSSRGVRSGSDMCVDRVAAYYAPQGTEARLEDFEFLVHASRAWQATAHTARLIVFTDTGTRTQLARTCRAHAECRYLSALPFRHSRTTDAYTEFVQILLGSLRGLVDATEVSHRTACCVPAAGILIYAPAVGQRGASHDSRVLLQHTRRNTITCLDVNPSPCMVFSW
jgi:hypothetical protein